MADDIKRKKDADKELIKKEIKTEKADKENKEKRDSKDKKENKKDKRNKEKKVKKQVYHDYSLVFAILFLVVFGLIMIYSASSYIGFKRFNDTAFFVKKQFKYSLAGIFCLILVSRVPYMLYIKLSKAIYTVSLFLVTIVLVVGTVAKGSKRWFRFGSINFQPSETVKIAIIILLSYYLVRYSDELHSSDKKVANRKLRNILIITIIPACMVGIENLSTAIIIFLIAFFMSFLGTSRKKWHAIGAAGMLGALMFAKKFIKIIYYAGLNGYRMKRLLVWIEPEKYSTDGGYQVVQGFYSIGSGGLFGKGLGQGMQKFFLPESQNDMIFAIIVEELGLFGAILLLSIFAFIISRMIKIALAVKNPEGKYIVLGVMIHISLQVILNIAVVTGVLPNTGVTFPFISYGGSSIFLTLGEMGIVLNVARTIKMDNS